MYRTDSSRDQDLDPLLEDDADPAEDRHEAEPVDRQAEAGSRSDRVAVGESSAGTLGTLGTVMGFDLETCPASDAAPGASYDAVVAFP